MKVRKQVEWFAGLMEDVLADNDHKSGWEQDAVKALMDRLWDEVYELQCALDEGPTAAIIKEAVDVANFAMMIADNLAKDEAAFKPGLYVDKAKITKQLAAFGEQDIYSIINSLKEEYGKNLYFGPGDYPTYLNRYDLMLEKVIDRKSTMKCLRDLTNCSLKRAKEIVDCDGSQVIFTTFDSDAAKEVAKKFDNIASVNIEIREVVPADV